MGNERYQIVLAVDRQRLLQAQAETESARLELARTNGYLEATLINGGLIGVISGLAGLRLTDKMIGLEDSSKTGACTATLQAPEKATDISVPLIFGAETFGASAALLYGAYRYAKRMLKSNDQSRLASQKPQKEEVFTVTREIRTPIEY